MLTRMNSQFNKKHRYRLGGRRPVFILLPVALSKWLFQTCRSTLKGIRCFHSMRKRELFVVWVQELRHAWQHKNGVSIPYGNYLLFGSRPLKPLIHKAFRGLFRGPLFSWHNFSINLHKIRLHKRQSNYFQPCTSLFYCVSPAYLQKKYFPSNPGVFCTA